MERITSLTIIMGILGVIIILLGVFSMDTGTIINIIPLFFHKYSRFIWVKAIESQFPNFLRDVADLLRSGMSFQEAVKSVSKSNYGKLTNEVRAMANRLSWGTPFIRTLEIFGEKVKDSKIITEVLHIIRESYYSGGNVADTLDSVASNIIMLKEAEAEKSSITRQQITTIYGIYFLFIAITLIITSILVPMVTNKMFATPTETTGVFSLLSLTFKNPCEISYMFPCSLYSGVAAMLGVPEGIGSYYLSMFFLTIIIEGIFLGLIVGQLSSNSLSAGIKHSFIMVFIGISIFIFLAKSGILPV